MTRRYAPPAGHHAAMPFLSLAGAMVSITSGAVIATRLFGAIGPVGTTALRLGIAAIMLSVVFRIWRMPVTGGSLRAAVTYGVALGSMNMLFYMAIDRIPLGIAIAFEFSGPLVVATLSSRRASHFGWIALAVAGLCMLLLVGRTHGALDHRGIACALGAGAFWGLYIVAGRRAGDALGACAPAWGMIVGTAVALPFGIASQGTGLLAGGVLAIALVVALLSSAIPYSLEMFALRRLPTRTFGVLTSAEPAVGAVMGALFLHEMLPLSKWLGLATVMAASIGMTLDSREPAEEAMVPEPPL